jgi:hypothetical protein
MRAALLSDLLRQGSTQDTTKVVSNWMRTLLGLSTLEVEQYASDWKMAREIVTSRSFRAIYPEAPAAKSYFKHTAHGLIHYKWIVNAVVALMDGGDGWYRRVNQFIVFDSKVNLTSLDLSFDCCRDYLVFESEESLMRRLSWCIPSSAFWMNGDDGPVTVEGITRENTLAPYTNDELITIAQRAARDLAGTFNIRQYPFRPRHGNGATLEVKRSEADAWHKNRHFKVDGDIITYLKYRVDEDDWHDWFYAPYRGLDRTSQVVCVPKSMTANRTISKEPTTLQYLQQDVFQALDDYFKENLADRIDLHDQQRSRLLAQVGSSDGSYATIDLSSASDSVSVRLVEWLFDGMDILYPLMATRSTKVHVADSSGLISTTLESSKFAPMGSATCFPVECLVFSILAEVAVRVHSGRRSRSLDYVVYGDDIVIRTEFAETAIDVLTHFGFEVNATKSFFDRAEAVGDDVKQSHLFREACGIECLDGEDITPLRLSRRLVSVTDNDSDRLAGQGVGLVDLVNRAYLYGYHELRRWIVSELRRHKWFRTCLRVSLSDYCCFCKAVARGLTPWVRVAIPFVITDDACDTQWRCFAARGGVKVPVQQAQAKVTVARPRSGKQPAVSRLKTTSVRLPSGRTDTHHDENDYFSWCLAQVTDPVASDEFVLDDTGVVTIRSQDLKWSKSWVTLTRVAHLPEPSQLG